MESYFRIRVIVEGQTEATLLNEFLAAYFGSQQIYIEATPITTRQAYGKLSAKKGGVPKFSRIKREIKSHLHDSSLSLLTTMFDFYGLPGDFPGMKDEKTSKETCYQQVQNLERALEEDISDNRFMAYFSLHEVEALLFTQPEAILQAAGAYDEKALEQLKSIRDDVISPEEINKTHPPSRRIQEIVPSYRKVGNIVKAAEIIGLPAMRQDCPHFNQWIERIEALAN